ncbi:hypothetical protein BG60_26760 [Caballeronia zhejiangensis]|uniref:Uncharacterized protein n=1 Tax=Caballeronia zhejiangensis TaxID=871203 RepID=A0A656QAD4_9BURK|nr:hypothetical protein BG58_29175 [Caballeronia jiangsuensis]KDR25892.1 hypothetical protein BG60_26760 [Caballeronia zhejiangensis]
MVTSCQTTENASGCQGDVVFVPVPGQDVFVGFLEMNLRVAIKSNVFEQGATEGNVHLLTTTADRKKRHGAPCCSLKKLQGDMISVSINERLASGKTAVTRRIDI